MKKNILYLACFFWLISSSAQDTTPDVQKIIQSDGTGITIINDHTTDSILFKKNEDGSFTEGEDTPKDNGSEYAHAVASKDYAKIEQLLQSGISPETVLFEGDTALHLGASWGDIQLISLMLKYKANIHAVNSRGETPLQMACSSQNIENIKLLLSQRNAKSIDEEINKKTKNGRTCLHMAVLSQKANTQTIEYISSLHPQLIPDENGQTAAHYAGALRKWDILLQLLKDNKIDISIKDNFGNSIDDYIMKKSDIFSRINFLPYLPPIEQEEVKNKVYIQNLIK